LDLENFKIKSQQSKKENSFFLRSLKKKNERNLDDSFHQLHTDVFENTNCLKCANCCKTTSPMVRETDISKIAQHLKKKPGDIIAKYFLKENDGTYIVNSAPCPFLDTENYCSIYAVRPGACREFPHTNRKKMSQILDITFENTLVCPAVLEIVEQLKKIQL
jgi:Fe-S-cluster containining protein